MNNEKNVFSKFNKLLDNYSNIISFLSFLLSFFGLFMVGTFYYKIVHIEEEIFNHIDYQINGVIENHTKNQYSIDDIFYEAPNYLDYISKAKSGDIFSEMFVARYYKEIGDYDSSIDWYQNVINSDNEFQAIAYNNLGWLYANGYGLYDCERYSLES